MPVVDVAALQLKFKSFQLQIKSIGEYAKTINLLTNQIKTLGGIRTSIDDMKRGMFNAKDSLEGAFTNLQGSLEGLHGAMDNAEIKSLFSIKRSSIGNGSGGILYEDISGKINAYLKIADDEMIKAMGGKKKAKELQVKLYTIQKALSQTNLNDFKSVMSANINGKEMEKSLLIQDYLKNIESVTKENIQQDGFANVQADYNEWFHPTEEQKAKRKKERERLSSFTKYITSSTDINQQTQTTNMILQEMLKIMMKEYKSALKYRNSIASLYLKNYNNPSFLNQVATNRDKIQEKINKVEKSVYSNSTKHGSLKKAAPSGAGFRF